ncbi:MAG: EamA family transporter [Hydrogenophaga sp.]|jgi:multidrug transporter EmrE-like cation transporter|uniref:SMR family transporter n=1 Tax=Hydrogenophaga sp. TaxID=1904254 RepID=UPI001DB10CE6|nr:SMR family transporter [Hydrogenophaga sp.]MBW0171692.1 EamA family transporter [Hydrogenophaga sp.]MBW0183992.1 EamA family transporter [Hydrogenophaga sp.]
MKSVALGLALFCVLLSSAAQIAMKRGMGAPAAADVGSIYLQALSSPMVWLGLMLYGASAVLWLWVLSRLDVSVAYPLVSLGFVVTLALGVLWLGEPFSWLRVAGCTLIVVGVSLLALDA